MMADNRPQPVGMFAQARERYGRSTMAQLLIFVGISLAANMLMRGVNTVFNLMGSFVAVQSMDAFAVFSRLISYVTSALNLALSIGLLFLHRHVTFRSADRIVCTVLPMIGLMLLEKLLEWFAPIVLFQFVDLLVMVYWFIDEAWSWAVIVSMIGAYLAILLVPVLITFAMTGTVHLAHSRGKRALCILPALSLLPLAFLNALAWSAWTYASWGIRMRQDGFLVVLFTFLLSVLQAVVCSVGSFFAYRKLLYRDTCDTTPAARRYILARWQAAEGAALSATMQVAGSVDTERNEMQ